MDTKEIASYGDGGYWRRGRLLGEGNYGAVFLATSKDKSPTCSTYLPDCPSVIAVKSAEIYCSETLRLERSVLSHLSDCSSIITCFGAEITRKSDGTGVYNLLLEYGSGGTLDDRIEMIRTRAGGLSEPEVRWHTRSIVEGLVRIHEAGFVHCDLKPDNILLFPTNQRGEHEVQAKICDFGLAKGVKEDRQRRKMDRFWNGTAMYLSPEAVKENVQEKPSDIWSLGIIVLEMLTGRCPWDLEEGSGTVAEKVLRKLQKGGCVPEIPANLSPEAKSFLQSCLKRMAKNRGTAKWLLRHPFISGIRVGPRPRPENTSDLSRTCNRPSELIPDFIPNVHIRFE